MLDKQGTGSVRDTRRKLASKFVFICVYSWLEISYG